MKAISIIKMLLFLFILLIYINVGSATVYSISLTGNQNLSVNPSFLYDFTDFSACSGHGSGTGKYNAWVNSSGIEVGRQTVNGYALLNISSLGISPTANITVVRINVASYSAGSDFYFPSGVTQTSWAVTSTGWKNLTFTQWTYSIGADNELSNVAPNTCYAPFMLQENNADSAYLKISDIEITTNEIEESFNGSNAIIFSNTSDYTQNITTHPINTLLYITTFLNSSLWDSWWVRNFATLNYIVPSGESYNIGYITQQNASQYSIIPDQNGIYNFTVRCDFFCGVFDYYTIFSEEINIIYPYNEPDDLLFSDTLDYNTSISEHPLNESFYLNVWIAEGSSMSESDYFGHWRINVTSPTDTYLGTYYPVRNYYQGSYPIQISMDQFNGTGKYGNYTFKMYFALTPDEMNTGEVLIKEAVINLYNVSNYNDTGYYNNITEELGDVPYSDISNYTDIPELQFLNNSFSYDTFVWIATPIHTMHIGIDSINNYYSDTNNTQHITVLGSIVPILISNLPEKVKLLFTYQIILTIILLIMGRD